MAPESSQPEISTVDEYCLHIAGYVVIPGVLTPQEVAACNEAIDRVGRREGMLDWETPWCDPFVQLHGHPVLTGYLDQLCYQKSRLDRPPRLLDDQVAPSAPLAGGGEPRNWSGSYYHGNESRFILGVHAIWALEDIDEGDGGFSLVPCSHKSFVETPADILDGSDDMDLTLQPVLKAGDLLLSVATLLQGMRPWRGEAKRLLGSGYISGLVRRSNGAPSEDHDGDHPGWVEEMTPEQRVILGVDQSNPAPVVHSDGVKTWVDEAPGTYHPSTMIRDPDCQIDEKEFYFWDLNGYLVLRDVMDKAWLVAANEAIDDAADRIVKGGDSTHDTKRLAGTALSSLSGLFDLPHPHGEPFRRMIANPALVQRLNWISGSGFVVDAARAIIYEKGTSGHGVHSGCFPGTARSIYALQNGRTYCETINVAWQLRDVNAGDGGFFGIPGSHKTSLPLPDDVRSLEDERGLIRHVAMKAGDVVLFMGSAQIHGAYPWTNDTPRRAVIVNYVSRNLDKPPRRF
jgi:ectoine hydroxylase-related dioxygenase (phytanoyl-CoA dioxygenase family)